MLWATLELATLVWVISSGAIAAEHARRQPAPALIPVRRASPEIPASFDVTRAFVSRRPAALEVREQDGNMLSRRGTLMNIQNLLYSKQSYNVFVQIGEVPFELALDTGSSDTWVISDDCNTPQCKNNPKYPLKTYKSPTFVIINNNQTAFSVSFADQTGASGFVARETLKLGNVQVEGQGIGIATSSNLTLGENVSGLLGLGFQRLSRIAASIENGPPFLSALSQAGQLSYPLFGLSLRRDNNGTLALGAIDRSVVSNTSLISWHDVVPFLPLPGENTTSIYLHWAIPLSAVSINSTENATPTTIPLRPTYENITGPEPLALIDVGFMGISGPLQEVAAIFTAMRSVRQATPGTWVLPCDTQATMTFSFAGTNVILQPRDYLIGPTQGDAKLCLSWPVASQPGPDGLDWHFGMPLLRTMYTIFSYGVAGKEPPLIGLYPLSNTSAVTDTPDSLSSLFSSLSLTVTTTVPAILLPTPTFSVAPYIFNLSTTPAPTVGQTLPTQFDAGNSTYSHIFTQASSGLAELTNVTALPMLDAPSPVQTLTVTDSFGSVHTTISTSTQVPTDSLGRPPGSFKVSDAMRMTTIPFRLLSSSLSLLMVTSLWTLL